MPAIPRKPWRSSATVSTFGGVRTNLLVGYRGVGIKLEDNDLRLTIQTRGAIVWLAFEFWNRGCLS